jgi:hypothetical protein
MSLEKWVEIGWLKREPTSPGEITGLLSIVERGLTDAKVTAISVDLRFISAFNGSLTAATVALRASGYRTATQAGHHVRTIESLEFTMQFDAKLIQKLKVFNSKRNQSSYDVAGAVSEQDLQSIMRLGSELQRGLKAWLQQSHPELL